MLMLNFTKFTKNNTNVIDENVDYDSEYEGLSEFYSHYINNDEYEPVVESYILQQNSILLEAENVELKKQVNAEIASALERHESKHGYGVPIGPPVKGHEGVAKLSANAVTEHYNKAPEEQQTALKAASKRLGYTLYGDTDITPERMGKLLTGGNKKTDTVLKNPLVTRNGKQTGAISSLGGAPDTYTHYHDSSLSKSSTVNTCAHATEACRRGGTYDIPQPDTKLGKPRPAKTVCIGAACLAKSGGFNFKNSVIKYQLHSHINNGAHTAADRAILLAHHLKTTSNEVEKNNEIHAVRGQTTDERGVDIRAIANAVHKVDPKIAKNTTLFGYSKNPKEVLDAARRTKRGEGVPEIISHSHPGPAYHQDDTGQLHLNPKNIGRLKQLRQSHEIADKEKLNVNDYIVAGGRSMDETGKIIPGSSHKQPDRAPSIGPEATPDQVKKHAVKSVKYKKAFDRFDRIDGSIKKVRYWDLHHSGELAEGEPETAHDEKTGRGYATFTQKEGDTHKRYKIGYYDRSANVGNTESGHTTYKQRHDGRYTDAETKQSNATVSPPVASTATHQSVGNYPNALSHQVHVSLDINGNTLPHSSPNTLHDAHPAHMISAGYTYANKADTYKNINVDKDNKVNVELK